MELKDKKIIVTGGARGIGKELVRRLLNEHATVGVLDIDPAALENLKTDHSDVICVQCDVTVPEQVGRSIDKLFDELGQIDALINNAGVIYNSPLIRLASTGLQKHDFGMWDKIVATDLNSVFYVTAHTVEKMLSKRTRGVIANISSVCASGNAGQSAYAAAKAGVNALTITWAKELGPLGIRVVGIAPGYSDTESTHEAMGDDTLKDVVSSVPLRRLGKVGEIADGILYAIKNDFFHGRVLQIDGGLRI